MKLSILLPTRERLELLRQAVETVRRQEDEDWELVISDNASEQDIAGYVESLADERIVYVRTPEFVHVTENWNNALRHSSGDYAIMLGDDDALLPGFVARVHGLVESFDGLDLIYSSALIYAYPGVLPEAPEGYLRPYGYAPFLQGREEPYALDRETARRMVREALALRVRYGFNMQFATFSRGMVERLERYGEFFQSPFPDYYTMNMLFLEAERIVVEPRPLTVIGLTPRSYGFFFFNQREGEGKSFLEAGADQEREQLLPGSNLNNSWLLAVETLWERKGRPPELRPDYGRYRRLQIASVYEHHFLHGSVDRAGLDDLRERIGPGARLVNDVLWRGLRLVQRLLPRRGREMLVQAIRRLERQTIVSWNPPPEPGNYADVVEVFERWDSGERRKTAV